MEDCKSLDPRPLPGPRAPAQQQKATRWVAAGIAAGMLFLSTTRFFPVKVSTSPVAATTTPFSWDQLQPSKSLEYSDCGSGFQCARLEVPMDYKKTSDQDRKVALAVVRIPAKVPVGDPRYGGAVLINPGKCIYAQRLRGERSANYY